LETPRSSSVGVGGAFTGGLYHGWGARRGRPNLWD
jgi:hypothetical protein